MLKSIFAGLILIHGLIHLMGFVKAFGLAPLDMLTLSISKRSGRLWLLAAFLFILTAVIVLLNWNWWWIVSVPAILLSQILIIRYWQDAKFGTLANLIILLVTTVGFGSWNFNTMVKHELKSFLAFIPVKKTISTEDILSGQPAIVQKWLQRSGITGREIIHDVYLQQQGEMRNTPQGKWMPLKAEQWFRTAEPGFIWKAGVNIVPGIYITARDKYEHGRGYMLIKLLSLFTIADAAGKEINQGAMLRYLSETFWFPSAALFKFLQWQQIDSLTARVTMTYGGLSDSALVKFDAQGDMVSFEARRFYDRPDGPTLEDWFIQVEPDGYREFAGIRIPAKAAVTWKLKEGDFDWLKLEITDVRYNNFITH
jgi:hypothetical protein